jgi:ribosomal protein S18 acetylase RimI-like enzyme
MAESTNVKSISLASREHIPFIKDLSEDPSVNAGFHENFYKICTSRDHGMRTFICWIDDVPAGFLIAKDMTNEQLDKITRVVLLAVSPSFRRRGCARALLENLEQIERQEEFPVINLHVRCVNTAATRLYYSMGYRIISVIDNYYNDGADGRRAYKLEKRL